MEKAPVKYVGNYVVRTKGKYPRPGRTLVVGDNIEDVKHFLKNERTIWRWDNCARFYRVFR